MGNIASQNKSSLFDRLIVWPSGANAEILIKCQSELNYYVGLSLMVLLTSTLAGFGMTLMLAQSNAPTDRAIAGGVFWGISILALDRFLLLVAYDTTGWKKFVPITRILLSLCLAIVVGEHVVHYLFRNEINNQLMQDAIVAQQSNAANARAGVPEIANLEEEKKEKKEEIIRKEAEVNKLHDQYIQEAEGSAGSRIPGKGSLFEQKQRDYLVAIAEKQKLEEGLAKIDARLTELFKGIEPTIQAANDVKANERGFLAHHRALMMIIKQNSTMLILYIVITMAMVLFELSPLLSKLGGKPKLHDELLLKEMEAERTRAAEHSRVELKASIEQLRQGEKLDNVVTQLSAEILNQIVTAVRNGNRTNLDGRQTEIADMLDFNIHNDINNRIKKNFPKAQARTDNQAMIADDPPSDHFNINHPASVKAIFKENENESPFLVIFRVPKEQVLGSDLLFSLKALESQRPGGSASRVPLHEYNVMNAADELIRPDKPLFRQIGEDNSVYLSLFGPTISNVEN